MPIYEYIGSQCKKVFSGAVSLEKSGQMPKCPQCNSDAVVKKYSGFLAVTTKKS